MHRCLATKLQIVVICPALIELPGGFLLPQLTSILKPDKVLGLLLDVTEEKISDLHKSCELVIRYFQNIELSIKNFFSDILNSENPNFILKNLKFFDVFEMFRCFG